MNDFVATMSQDDSLTEEDQKKAGQAIAGSMDDEHKKFVTEVSKMVREGTLDLSNPKSLLKMDVYESLDEEWQEKADLVLMNLVDQLRMIVEFYDSSETPDESPQLTTMIDALWHTKQKIEEEHDVFTF